MHGSQLKKFKRKSAKWYMLKKETVLEQSKLVAVLVRRLSEK